MPERKLFESRSRSWSRNKKFRLRNTAEGARPPSGIVVMPMTMFEMKSGNLSTGWQLSQPKGVSQEIPSNDRKLDSSKQKGPLKTLSMSQSQLFLPPAKNWLSCWANEVRTRSGSAVMRDYRVAGASID